MLVVICILIIHTLPFLFLPSLDSYMLPGHPSGPGDPPKPWLEVLMSESPVSKGGTVLRPFYILSITPPMVLIIISVSDGDLHPDYSLLYLESSRFLKTYWPSLRS